MCMRLSRSITALAALASVAALTACGGGGGSSGPTLTGPASPKMELSASRTTVPVQQAGNYLYPDQTTLYTTRITANVRDSRGNAIPGGGQVEFALVGGVTDRGALYQTDFEDKVEVTYADGSTRDVPAAFWGLPVEVAGSSAQVLFQGHTQTGQVEIRATYAGPNGGVVQKSIPITIEPLPNATGLPSTLDLWVRGTPIFIAGQNRNDQATINAYLADPAGQPIEAGSGNNLRAEIIGDDLGGAYLLGSDGQIGRSVATRTIAGSGQAQISVKSGSKSGSLTIRLTADRSDNNVDNDIQDPITKETRIAISDGQTASLSFGGPYVDAIINNKTTAEMEEGDFIDQGVYSRSVSVVVTDRNGNPVPGETIRFGLIDAPLQAGSFPDPNFSLQPVTSTTTVDPRFAIQGSKGNPEEGGFRFDQDDGLSFKAAGVGYLDRLLLWPSEQGTQREMQVSRLVERLPGASIITTRAFPYLKDVPGYVDGYNIPWVVGRAQYGNIGATAVTDQNGVAQTFINYPVSRLNQPAILTAEAENGVSTHFNAYYAGVAGGTLTSSVTSVPPGGTTQVTMCAADANRAPRQGITLTAGLTNGASTSGSLTTGTDGCARFALHTMSNPDGTDEFTIPFSSGDGDDERIEITVTKSDPIEVPEAPAVRAPILSVAGPGNGSREVTAYVLDSNGDPVSGQTVVFTATATDDGNLPLASITSITDSGSDTTGTDGAATVTISYDGNAGDTYDVTATSSGGSDTVPFPY